MVKVVKQAKDKQQSRPLFHALERHRQQEKTSFHVPGHKNGLNWPADSWMKKALMFDQTEVSGLDYLHEAKGVLEESQSLLSAYYGSKQSYYLINGSTGGNLAMITGVLSKGDTVLVDRTSHQSVMHALELAEAVPLFLLPEYNAKKKDTVDLTLEAVRRGFERGVGVKTLILTYPSYNGQVSDLKAIIDYCHEQGAVVLVDEAHGAHFTLGSPFPPSALDLGADVVVHSAHKMLPAMTQSGYLHIGKQLSPQMHRQIERGLHMLQSSSPSYLLMQSLEYARYFLTQFTEADLEQTLAYRNQWIDVFVEQGLNFWPSDDPLKVRLGWIGHSGVELGEALEKQGLFPEKTDHEAVLLTFPLLKQGDVSIDCLKAFHLPKSSSKRTAPLMPEGLLLEMASVSELQMSYTEQMSTDVESVPLKKAMGRITAQNITPYPPGVPLVLKGQMVTSPMLRTLEGILAEEYRIVGISKAREISVFKR